MVSCRPAATKVEPMATPACQGWRKHMRVMRMSAFSPRPQPAAVTWAKGSPFPAFALLASAVIGGLGRPPFASATHSGVVRPFASGGMPSFL